MKKVIISEIVEAVDSAAGPGEVCASADADYDEGTQRLSVTLDSFLRTSDPRRAETRLEAAWLPRRETLRESVGPCEASDAAKEIFGRWVNRVRQAIPPTAHRH
jgi:hypothetical protein